MIFKKRLFFSTACYFLLFQLNAIQAAEHPAAGQAIGFGGGSATGPGITYRHYSSDSFYQGQFFARTDSRDTLQDLMIGISYGKVISQITVVKALPPTTLLFVSGIDGHYLKNQFVAGIGQQPGNERSFHIGAGVALDIGNTFSPGLVFSLGTSYVLEWIREDSPWAWNLGPQIHVVMLYNW